MPLSLLLLMLLSAYLHAIKLIVAGEPFLGGWLAGVMDSAGMPVLSHACHQHAVRHGPYLILPVHRQGTFAVMSLTRLAVVGTARLPGRRRWSASMTWPKSVSGRCWLRTRLPVTLKRTTGEGPSILAGADPSAPHSWLCLCASTLCGLWPLSSSHLCLWTHTQEQVSLLSELCLSSRPGAWSCHASFLSDLAANGSDWLAS